MPFLMFAFLNSKLLVISRFIISRKYTTKNVICRVLEEMAPEKKHIKEARIAYENRKDNMSKYQSNDVYLEVVGSGAYGAPRSVHLFTNNCRYLFNCGEGTQRISIDNKVKLSKLPHVFITYPSWENISGLVGVALTVQSIGIPELFIHGHRNIENVYSATNKFVALKSLRVSMKECDPKNEFSDGIVKIKYVHLYPSSSNNLNKTLSDSTFKSFQEKESKSFNEEEKFLSYTDENSDSDNDIDYYEHLVSHIEHEKKILGKMHKKMRSQSEEHHKNNSSKEKFAISYICKTNKSPGTLLIEKCIELGLRPGPILGRLKSGEDVQLENGTIVKSSDVTLPETPGAIIIVVECPSDEYLDSLLKEPAFYQYQSSESNCNENASVVIHFTSSKLVKHSKYQEWINRFSTETKHLFINEDNISLGLKNAYSYQQSLNLLHSDIFPLLHFPIPATSKENENDFRNSHIIVPENYKSEVQPQDSKNDILCGRKFYKCSNNCYIKGESLCEVYIKPKRDYDYSYCLELNENDVLKKVLDIEGFKNELEKLKINLKEMESMIQLDKRKYPKILFLGTGSSHPSKRRNTSGILIFLDEKNLILLDCGEGTYGQMVRFYGKEKAKEVLRNLNMIYVSHMHADHHLGLITLLKERKIAFNEIGENNSEESKSQDIAKLKAILEGTYTNYRKLYLLAPKPLTRWLGLYSKYFENICDTYDFIPNSYFMKKKHQVDMPNKWMNDTNLKEITTTYVEHCPNAFGISIVHNDGWKITYSGDTKPCQNLIDIGYDSDILIHEATMDDSLSVEASLKLHSTTSQAIEVGKKMKAKFILLTHFSQRYSHIPLFNEKFTDEVGIAFDNMMVSINQLPLLPKLNEALKVLFSEQYEKMEEKKNLYILNQRKRKALNSPEGSDNQDKLLIKSYHTN